MSKGHKTTHLYLSRVKKKLKASHQLGIFIAQAGCYHELDLINDFRKAFMGVEMW